MQSGRQFEYDMVLDSELDLNSAILSWIGSPPSRARLLGSLALLDALFVLHGHLLDS
jgi:hypothetical protein